MDTHHTPTLPEHATPELTLNKIQTLLALLSEQEKNEVLLKLSANKDEEEKGKKRKISGIQESLPVEEIKRSILMGNYQDLYNELMYSSECQYDFNAKWPQINLSRPNGVLCNNGKPLEYNGDLELFIFGRKIPEQKRMGPRPKFSNCVTSGQWDKIPAHPNLEYSVDTAKYTQYGYYGTFIRTIPASGTSALIISRSRMLGRQSNKTRRNQFQLQNNERLQFGSAENTSNMDIGHSHVNAESSLPFQPQQEYEFALKFEKAFDEFDWDEFDQKFMSDPNLHDITWGNELPGCTIITLISTDYTRHKSALQSMFRSSDGKIRNLMERTADGNWILVEGQESGGHNRSSTIDELSNRFKESCRLLSDTIDSKVEDEADSNVLRSLVIELSDLHQISTKTCLGENFVDEDQFITKLEKVAGCYHRGTFCGSIVSLKDIERTIPNLNYIRFYLQHRHENIFNLYHYSLSNVLVFESLDTSCNNLHEFIAHNAIDERQICRFVRDIANGLYYLHSRNEVHGDLTSCDILISSSGTLKIHNFGLNSFNMNKETFKLVQNSIKSTHWWSPERWLGEDVSTQSDIFALGIIAYQMVTGSLPFVEKGQSELDDVDIQERMTNEMEVDILSNSMSGLKINLGRCLSWDKLKRPSTLDLSEELMNV